MREGIQTGIDDAQQALIDRLQGKVSTAEQELGSIPAMQRAFETGEFTPELLAELGLEDNRLYGVDPYEYLKGAPTIANVATQEDLARAQALAGLEGTQQDIFLDPNEIGTYKDTETASLDQLRDQIAMAKKAYESEISPQEAYLNLLRQDALIEDAQYRPDESWITGSRFNAERIAELTKAIQEMEGMQGSGNLPGIKAGPSMTQEQANAILAERLQPRIQSAENRIRDIQSKYGYDNVLTAEEGGVKTDARLASIKKLLGYE